MRNRTVTGRILRALRRPLVAGILVAIPLGITYIVVAWLFRAIDGILQPAISRVFGLSIPGVGIIGAIIIIYLLGLLTTNVLGRKLLAMMSSLLGRTPIVSSIYSAARQVVEALRLSQETPFKRVVVVNYPRNGIKAVGFATGPAVEVQGERMLPIYIPTAPNPTSGFIILFPENEVVFTTMSPDTAFRMVVSGGMVSPTSIAASGEGGVDKS
jgi:uncharacterized membrane protein